MGPLLFLIYFNNLPLFLNENIECYADDSTISASGLSSLDIGNKLSSDCSKLSEWMTANKFKLNATKTVVMRMGSSQKLAKTQDLKVSMDGLLLKETQNEAEPLLGVQLQNNLKWTKQVQCLSLRLKKRLAGLEKLKFVMSCSVKNRVVQGIFNSVLCYCLPLFGGCTKQELDLLQSQQNKAARIVLGLPPRSNRDSTFNAVK